jgi:hypothetical protein
MEVEYYISVYFVFLMRNKKMIFIIEMSEYYWKLKSKSEVEKPSFEFVAKCLSITISYIQES